ncbi:MAG: hypothetical protein IJA72_01920 [Clostridia bacterium]|nr:hypothetical protein [Clostridia bacterium]
MWKKDCQEIANLEDLENLFTSFYGEEHRQEIHDKFANTNFIFMATDEYIATDAIHDIFPEVSKDNSSIIPIMSEMVKDLENDPKSILKYLNFTQTLGYNREEILHKNILQRKYTLGSKYEEFISKVTRVQSFLPKGLPSVEEEISQRFQQHNPNIEISNINQLYFLLRMDSSQEQWKNSLYQSSYIGLFNIAFGTKFKSFQDIEKNSKFTQVLSSVEDYRQLYWEMLQTQGYDNHNSHYHNMTTIDTNNAYIISNNIEEANKRAEQNNYKYNLHGTTQGTTTSVNNNTCCDVVIKVNNDLGISIIVHELTHVLHQYNEYFGFDRNDDTTEPFNEIVTEYLTQRMMEQSKIESDFNRPFNKKFNASYSRGFLILNDFLKTYEPLLKECQFRANSTYDLIDAIGEIEYNRLINLTYRYMQMNEFTYIAKINEELKTDYKSFLDIIENLNLIYDKFADNEQITNYLDVVDNLYLLSCDLAQKQQFNEQQGSPLSM